MSLIGKTHTITIARTGPVGGAVLSLVGFSIADFAHEVGFVTATSVVKADVTATLDDTYVVKIAYPNGSVPANTTTITNLITAASAAVTDVWPTEFD